MKSTRFPQRPQLLVVLNMDLSQTILTSSELVNELHIVFKHSRSGPDEKRTEVQKHIDRHGAYAVAVALTECAMIAYMRSPQQARQSHLEAPADQQHMVPDAAARLERILRLGRSMKWTPHGAPTLDDENTAVALGELFQIFFQDAVDRALATTEGSKP